MRKRFGIFALSLLFVTRVHASAYEITFEEGFYKFATDSTPTDVNSKYLARVTVKKDGRLVANDIRGSTLPDAWTFYRRWNVELKKTTTPNDTDIVAMLITSNSRQPDIGEAGPNWGKRGSPISRTSWTYSTAYRRYRAGHTFS